MGLPKDLARIVDGGASASTRDRGLVPLAFREGGINLLFFYPAASLNSTTSTRKSTRQQRAYHPFGFLDGHNPANYTYCIPIDACGPIRLDHPVTVPSFKSP